MPAGFRMQTRACARSHAHKEDGLLGNEPRGSSRMCAAALQLTSGSPPAKRLRPADDAAAASGRLRSVGPLSPGPAFGRIRPAEEGARPVFLTKSEREALRERAAAAAARGVVAAESGDRAAAVLGNKGASKGGVRARGELHRETRGTRCTRGMGGESLRRTCAGAENAAGGADARRHNGDRRGGGGGGDDEYDSQPQAAAQSPPAPASALASLALLELPQERPSAGPPPEELAQIRGHYLGLNRLPRKKAQKPSEKYRTVFNFEWSAAEDTTRGDANFLYRQRVEPQLLFGRGYRAGIDVREQRKCNSFYDKLVERRAEGPGVDGVGAGGPRGGEQGAAGSDAAAVPGRGASDAAGGLAAGAGRVLRASLEHNDPHSQHWSEKPSSQLTARDYRIMREDFSISVRGGGIPPPMRTWAEAGLPEPLVRAVALCGYAKPTAIQMQAIPVALQGRDLIGVAETGSGKTAAFVLPMLARILALPRLTEETVADGPYGLVLAPTRELALQIDAETRRFAHFCPAVRAAAVVGGRSTEAQGFELRRGCELLIGTPGRLRDCLERSFTVLNQCCYAVLDEGDRMIDMGFEEVVTWILDQVPPSVARVTQMFSATFSPAVERLAKKYLRAPAVVSVGDPGAGKRDIEQRLEFIPEPRKAARLEAILAASPPPIMVFVNQKKVVDVIVRNLTKAGFAAGGLHGGKVQDLREQSLADFKSGELDILVATDVAGRGIDVDSVQLVVNYDMPKDITAYTHRIGRTGRAGNKGLAISFITDADAEILPDLKTFLQSTNNVVPQQLAQHAAVKAVAQKLM